MIDLAIVLVFMLYALGAGLRARRSASRDLDSYFLAGRSLPGWKSGLSMAGTQFAADTPLLVAGLVATAGVFALWRLWVYGLAFLLMAFVLAALWRRAGVLTDAELTEVRYGGRGALVLRVLKALYYGTAVNCVVMAMVLVAAVRIAEVFLPWHAWLPEGLFQPVVGFVAAAGLTIGDSVTGLAPAVATADALISIGLILAFTAGYSTTGGLRSVVNTDVAQFSLAMVGTALYAWAAVETAGGLAGLGERVVDLYGRAEATKLLSFTPPGEADLLGPFLVLVGLQWAFQMNADGTGYLAQRSMACRSDREARTAGLVFAWMQILLRSLLWLAIAVSLLVIYPLPDGGGADAADRELLFVTGIDDLLAPGVRGLMLTGLLAALASTLDTHLNWGASYWSRDLYGRLICEAWLKRRPRDREQVLAARLSTLLILAIALAGMANLDSIQTAWFVSLLFGAGMGSVLILRWLWERITLWSEIAAMAASLVVAPILLWTLGTDPDTEWLRLGLMALITTAAAIGVTFLGPATRPEVLDAFYGRVRPVGLWRRTAERAGEPPHAPTRALGRGLLLTATAAGSLFLLLAGTGRLMIPPPGASTAVTWALIATGLGLVPLWWAGMRRQDRESET